MTDFDPIRAAREQLAGLTDAHKAYSTDVRRSEQVLTEAEAHHNAARKMEAFAREAVKTQAALLRALEDEAARKAKGQQ